MTVDPHSLPLAQTVTAPVPWPRPRARVPDAYQHDKQARGNGALRRLPRRRHERRAARTAAAGATARPRARGSTDRTRTRQHRVPTDRAFQRLRQARRSTRPLSSSSSQTTTSAPGGPDAHGSSPSAEPSAQPATLLREPNHQPLARPPRRSTTSEPAAASPARGAPRPRGWPCAGRPDAPTPNHASVLANRRVADSSEQCRNTSRRCRAGPSPARDLVRWRQRFRLRTRARRWPAQGRCSGAGGLAALGVRIPPPALCGVSRHRRQMSRDTSARIGLNTLQISGS